MVSYLAASSALVGLVAGIGGCMDSSSDSESDSSSLDSNSSDDGEEPDFTGLGGLVVGVSDRREADLGAMMLPFLGFFVNFAIRGQRDPSIATR